MCSEIIDLKLQRKEIQRESKKKYWIFELLQDILKY